MNNEVLIPGQDNTLAIIQTAPDALMLNDQIVTKAVEVCNNLLAIAEKDGMSDELDLRINNALLKLKDRYGEIKDRRTPLTQMFDQIRSKFTELEAKIDPSKPGNIYAQLQSKRNAWATHKIELQKKADAERERKLRAEQEKINLKAEADIQLRNGFLSYLSSAKSQLQNLFNTTTLDNYIDNAQAIFDFSEIYKIDKFNALQVNMNAIYLSPAELELIITNARIGKFDAWNSEFQSAIRDMKTDLSQKMPGKKRELEQIYQAELDAAEAAKKAREAKNEADRIAAEEATRKAAAERERLENERIEREKREAEEKAEADRRAKIKAEQDAEAEKNLAQAELQFNNTIEAAAETEQINAIESYEIEVMNPAGWLLIAQFWYQNEGMKMSNSDIEKKTFKQMKSFCEKWYKKNGATGLSSPYIKYSPKYSVRAEK